MLGRDDDLKEHPEPHDHIWTEKQDQKEVEVIVEAVRWAYQPFLEAYLEIKDFLDIHKRLSYMESLMKKKKIIYTKFVLSNKMIL